MPPTRFKKRDSPDVCNTNDVYQSESKSEEETRRVRDEITSIYHKLVASKNSFATNDKYNEFKNILTEAKNVICRAKGIKGTIKDSKMFYLLCHTVDEISNDTNTNGQKFLMEEYAHHLSRKFNFSMDNFGKVTVTKLQVVSLGKKVSKYFTKAPTTKSVLGGLDTGEGEKSVKISDLPNELLRNIFLLLSLKDKKMAVLVSQRWRKVGEDPVLWKCCYINIDIGEDVKKLSVGRFHFVEDISLNVLFDGQLEEFFKATLELPRLKQISRLLEIDLRPVNSQLLGMALSKLEVLTLDNPGTSPNTTNEQRVAIFNGMAEKSLIEVLALANMDLRTLEVDADVLAKGMSNLSVLELCDVNFTKDQLRSVFTVINLKEKIEYLTILDINLSAVDPNLFAKVVSKLKEIELMRNDLTSQQVRALFTELKQNCELKRLDVILNDLSPVHPNDLATVVTNIEAVDLISTHLSTNQITALLTRVQETSKLKKLHIKRNRISQVQPAIITRAREIMDQLDFDSDSESEDELNAIDSDSGLTEDDESDTGS